MNIGQWYTYNGTPASSTSTHRAGIDVMVVSQNEINNTSLVRIRPWIMKLSGSGFWNYTNQTMTIEVNNSEKTTKTKYDFRDATVLNQKYFLKDDYPFFHVSGSGSLVSGTYVYDFTITHNNDGSKTIPIYALIPLSSTYGTNWTVDEDIELPTIPRANTLTYSYTTIDKPIKFSIGKASSNFTSTLTFHSRNEDGTYSDTYTIAEKTTETSIEYTIPTDVLNTILSANKTKNKISFFIYLYTYSGNNQLGYNLYITNIPLKQTNPIVSATYIDTNQTTIALTGNSSKIIKYVSKPKVVITATPQQMADIVSYSTIWGNSSSTTKETTFTNGIDSNILQVSAIDSRNWLGSARYDISSNFIEYIKLGFEKFTLERPETTSNTINANISGFWFNGDFGVSTNTLELKFRYKERDGSYGNYQTISLTKSENKFSFNGSVGSSYNYQKQYDFEFVLSDKLMSLVATFNVAGGESIIRVGETYVKVRGDLEIEGQLNIGGSIIRKVANTDALQTNSNFIVNNTGSFNDMLTAKGVTLFGGKGSLIGANYGDIFPVGGIYISSTNENPSSKLGGNWELIDKEFKAYAGASENFFNPNSNVESQETCLVRSGHSIFVRFKLVNAVAIGDTAIAFGEFDWQAMGFTSIGYGLFELVGGSDGGNAHATARIQASGEMTTIDVIGKTSSDTIAVGSTIYWIFSLPIRYTTMLDSFCDKFYWKRTA